MTERCPKCQDLRNMNVTRYEHEVTDAQGETKKIITESYQCEVCHTFVRSLDLETTS